MISECKSDLPDAESNTSRPLNKGELANLMLLRTFFVVS